jgi:DNA-binding transcriptional ArsR family regulator
MRTSQAELLRDAVRTFMDALASLGLGVRRGGDPDVVVVEGPAGARVEIQVAAASVLSGVMPKFEVGHRKLGTLQVVVADQIPASLRPVLNDADIGWLDRRGRLRLVAEGLFIDTDIAPAARFDSGRSSTTPISGRSGLCAAMGLLMRPEDPMKITELAEIAGLDVSSVSRAMSALSDAQLAERVGRGRYRPLTPELFWALADVWPRARTPVRLPVEALGDPRLGANLDALDDAGWAMGGERGAVAWGAPLALTADYPTLLYVPDDESLGRSKVIGGGDEAVSDRSRPLLELAVDPVGLLTHDRYPATNAETPLAHPVACALELAATSRGREALDQWDPPKGFVRVW